MNTASPLPVITLTTERLPGHPWIWSSQVRKPDNKLPPGSVVAIVDAKGRFVGHGFWNGHARIALRVLGTDPDVPLNEAFIRARIARAVALRRDVLALDAVSNAWRVINSEGDGLSGLVVDRYADSVVVEYFAAGMWRLREVIHAALAEHFPGTTLYAFAEQHVQKQESFDCRASEPPAPVAVREYDLTFHAAPGSGHKTGFFADQRDNRHRFAQLAKGRHVLDLCCNAGGFAIHAMAAGASAAIGVDADDGILDIARANARANQVAVDFQQADVFDWLKAARERGETFDAIVLDPPKLTRDRHQLVPTLKKYFAMNRLALDVLAHDGLLLTCSCTGLVRPDDFLDTLRRVSLNAGRDIQFLHVGGAGADHPVAAVAPEGRYLKAVFCRVS
ncbi:MAG TPA: class I SAM-dependent rRNA methyltransferase [Rhodanobacteraceae bacterium]